jgi:hypothetical protein
MNVIDSEFDFTYLRKRYQATVYLFTPVNAAMLRVRLELQDQTEKVFVFYKRKQGELFWYDLPDP